jgi:hypothetical protein
VRETPLRHNHAAVNRTMQLQLLLKSFPSDPLLEIRVGRRSEEEEEEGVEDVKRRGGKKNKQKKALSNFCVPSDWGRKQCSRQPGTLTSQPPAGTSHKLDAVERSGAIFFSQPGSTTSHVRSVTSHLGRWDVADGNTAEVSPSPGHYHGPKKHSLPVFLSC